METHREVTSFSDAQQSSTENKLLPVLNEGHPNGDESESETDSGEPDATADSAENTVGRIFEDDVADKEDSTQHGIVSTRRLNMRRC